MKKYLLLSISLIILGCSEPKIDASSEESLKSSVEKVKNSLSEKDQKEFEESLMFLAMQNLDLSDIFQSGVDPDAFAENYLNRIKNELDGKSASDIITKANALRQELEEKQRKQAIEEIEELEAKKRDAELAKEELLRFEILRSRFYKRADTFRDQPIIEMTIRNNTDFAVSRAYFRGTYATPGRQVPWLVDDFNYSISGGLEPGEEQSWSLAPNQFGDWGRLEARSDAILTIEVIRLDGPDGKALFNAQGLTSFEANRLIDLRSRYMD